MKTIEEAVDERYDHTALDRVSRGALEREFRAGAEWMREELTRWHGPKEELPEDDREVLCIVNRQHSKYAVLRHDNYGWWQYVPFQGGGWCGYDGEIIGWRYINE